MLKCFKNFDAKKTGLCSRCTVWYRRNQDSFQQGCKRNFIQIVQQPYSVQRKLFLKTATKVQENAEDIYAEAKQINEDRAAKEEEVFDGEEVTKETTAEETETTEETAEA